jgi:predicted RNA-binding Zn-ribbon protein involved in translation (DUF1610 family)
MVEGLRGKRGAAKLHAAEDLDPLWTLFRSGGAPTCPDEDVALALSVDAEAAIYRFVCPRCGRQSAWFQVTARGVVPVRSSLLPDAFAAFEHEVIAFAASPSRRAKDTRREARAEGETLAREARSARRVAAPRAKRR